MIPMEYKKAGKTKLENYKTYLDLVRDCCAKHEKITTGHPRNECGGISHQSFQAMIDLEIIVAINEAKNIYRFGDLAINDNTADALYSRAQDLRPERIAAKKAEKEATETPAPAFVSLYDALARITSIEQGIANCYEVINARYEEITEIKALIQSTINTKNTDIEPTTEADQPCH